MNIRFCVAVLVDDYHDFDYFVKALQIANLSRQELGTYNGQYIGIIFNGCPPNDGEISNILLAAGIYETMIGI